MRFITFRLKYAVMAIALVLLITLSAFTAAAADAAAVYWSGARSLPIYSVERKDNKVAISFDCAWGVDYTDQILGHLAVSYTHLTLPTMLYV